MSVIKMNLKEIIFCVAELIIGILLLINPVSFTAGIIVLCGVSMLATGILFGFKYFRLSPEEAKKGNLLTVGLILVLIGVFCMLRSDWLIETFPVLTVMYGLLMVLTGVSKIQIMVDMIRLHNKCFWAGINALVSIVCGIVILWAPFETTAILWIFAGVSLIIEAVLDIVTIFLTYIGMKENESVIEVVLDKVEDVNENNLGR